MKFKLTDRYVLDCFLAVFLNFFLHELAHWGAGELLGYKMEMALNKTFLIEGDYAFKFHGTIVDGAGPACTFLLATAVFYLLFKKERNEILYPFLLSAFYLRLLAAFSNFNKLNDEGRVGKDLGIGAFTLPILVCSLLFLMIYIVSVRNKYTVKFQMVTLLFIILFSSLIIWADHYFQYRIIG